MCQIKLCRPSRAAPNGKILDHAAWQNLPCSVRTTDLESRPPATTTL